MDKQPISAMVPKHKELPYIQCLHQWISNDQLERNLKYPDRYAVARHALKESLNGYLDNEALTTWCNSWLSEEGWKKLQDDVTQYQKRPKEGAKYKRVILEREIVDDLYCYAAHHSLPINEAVKKLLKNAPVETGKKSQDSE